MTTREVTWTAERLTRGLREATGDESIEVSIWAANVIAVRLAWPTSTARFTARTKTIKRALRRGGFKEAKFGPAPDGDSALLVLDRHNAWGREVRARMEGSDG